MIGQPTLFSSRVFPDGLPAIAFAAVVGIVLNLIFMLFKAPEEAELKVVDLED